MYIFTLQIEQILTISYICFRFLLNKVKKKRTREEGRQAGKQNNIDIVKVLPVSSLYLPYRIHFLKSIYITGKPLLIVFITQAITKLDYWFLVLNF